MKNKTTLLLLSIIIAIAVFVNFYKLFEVPACINSDEAAFGYNAFSLASTLRDEHGAFLPLRLRSFNDIKMPLYSYVSAPFVAAFGLNDFSIRLVSRLSGILLVIVMYVLARELFNNRKVALLSALLTALSPWVYIMSRHAHEAALTALIIGTAIILALKYAHTLHKRYGVMALFFILLSVFSYHSARIFFLLVTAWIITIFVSSLKKEKIFSRSNILFIFFAGVILLTPFIVDARYGTTRVNKLFFLSNPGFQLSLDEYLRDHPQRIIHNKGTQFIREVVFRYIPQVSPDFFLRHGDLNPRFGMDWLGLITPIEYIFIGIGIYYLFKTKFKHRWLIIMLFLIAPLGNAFTWQGQSLTRVFTMIIPLILIVAYGFSELRAHSVIIVGVIFAFIFFNFHNHDMYFNHYFMRPLNQRSWQCGYKEVAAYIKDTYKTNDTYYITLKHGQPYIFLLYFLNYDPQRYWATVQRSAEDETGFTQVLRFDKFIFEVPGDIPKNSMVIGYPDDFKAGTYDQNKVKHVRYGIEDIFWIYKN